MCVYDASRVIVQSYACVINRFVCVQKEGIVNLLMNSTVGAQLNLIMLL